VEMVEYKLDVNALERGRGKPHICGGQGEEAPLGILPTSPASN
jgi:hypothetical protein